MALPRALVGLAGVDPALLEVELSLSSVLTYLHINTQVRPTSIRRSGRRLARICTCSAPRAGVCSDLRLPSITAGRRAIIYRAFAWFGAPVVGRTREQLSACLFIGALGVNFRICRE